MSVRGVSHLQSESATTTDLVCHFCQFNRLSPTAVVLALVLRVLCQHVRSLPVFLFSSEHHRRRARLVAPSAGRGGEADGRMPETTHGDPTPCGYHGSASQQAARHPLRPAHRAPGNWQRALVLPNASSLARWLTHRLAESQPLPPDYSPRSNPLQLIVDEAINGEGCVTCEDLLVLRFKESPGMHPELPRRHDVKLSFCTRFVC